MAYTFVPSFYDYGPRNVNIRPLTINVHMAEGGGTVGYLAKDNPNKVAVHYVIEYGGRIVQMLHESHVNGSINPRDIRVTDDPPYTFRGEVIRYGATAAKRALGEWWDDPNRATIGIEIEGFAKDGPNATQAGALKRLVTDIRTRQPGAPLLGHRDFADYKACPGKRIDWGALGGHGTGENGDDFMGLEGGPVEPGKGIGSVTIKEGRGLVNLRTGKPQVPANAERSSFGRWRLAEPYGGEGIGRQMGYLVSLGAEGHIALDDVVEKYTPAEPEVPQEPGTPTVLTGDDGSVYRRE